MEKLMVIRKKLLRYLHSIRDYGRTPVAQQECDHLLIEGAIFAGTIPRRRPIHSMQYTTHSVGGFPTNLKSTRLGG